jgi:hypothetical protein
VADGLDSVPELRLVFQVQTRREREDRVALAFARLPPQRRAELLAGG